MEFFYQHYFHLREFPWGLSADPRFFWASHGLARAMERLSRGLDLRLGTLVVTGAPGVGKTMVCRVLAANLARAGSRHRLSWFPLSQGLTPRAIWAHVAGELAIDPLPRARTELVRAVEQALVARRAGGEELTLVVDEAQLLSREALLELKLMTNLEAPDKLVNVILVGQPPLLRRLRRPGLSSVASRVATRVHLEGLTAGEVGPYLRHRLQVAGLHEMPFSQDAVNVLARAAGGNPRRLNLLADLAMAEGARRRERFITGDTAAMAVEAAAATAALLL